MDEIKQEGFFRSEPQRPVLEVKVPPSVGSIEQPARKECTEAVHYLPGRPDMPAIQVGGEAWATGAELALAVALATLLKGSGVPLR